MAFLLDEAILYLHIFRAVTNDFVHVLCTVSALTYIMSMLLAA